MSTKMQEIEYWMEQARQAQRTETRICGLCGAEFTPNGSPRLICYSPKCIAEYDRARLDVDQPKPEPMPESNPTPIPLTKKGRKQEHHRETYEQNRKAGFVYLMRSENGYYKIGMSKNARNRLDGLRRQFPIMIEVIHQIASGDYRAAEKFLHRKYSDKRVENEWFKLDDEDVRWILSLRDHDLDDHRQ